MSYLESLYQLQDQVAVIIGGTGELCGHIAQGLAQSGVQVVLVGRSEEKAQQKLATIKQQGGQGYFLPIDLQDPQAFPQLRDQVLERSGKIDILINGAGTNSATPFNDIPLDEWNHILHVNLTATYQACQAFSEYFLQRYHQDQQPGSIINIGSISGLNPLSRVFTYSASKAAVHNLSQNLAREWADQGIRVNTLVPGFFPAEQNKKVLNQSRIDTILNKTPMNRFGNPEELIAATLLLASSKAGSFITGHELVVDGGYQAKSI